MSVLAADGPTPDLAPPYGATWGLVRNHFQNSQQITQSVWDLRKDSKQTISCGLNQLFYVYVEDGGAQPIYHIVLLQYGRASSGGAGAMLNNAAVGRFFMQPMVTVTVNAEGSDVPLVLQQVSPAPTITQAGVPIQDAINIPMSMIVGTHGGRSMQWWSANHSNALQTPEWGVQQAGDATTAGWTYYQAAVWNALTQPLADFGSWGGTLFDAKGNLAPFPAQSLTPLVFETLSWWTLTPGAKTPSTLPVTFNTSIVQNWAGIVTAETAGGPDPDAQGGQVVSQVPTVGFDVLQIVSSTRA